MGVQGCVSTFPVVITKLFNELEKGSHARGRNASQEDSSSPPGQGFPSATLSPVSLICFNICLNFFFFTTMRLPMGGGERDISGAVGSKPFIAHQSVFEVGSLGDISLHYETTARAGALGVPRAAGGDCRAGSRGIGRAVCAPGAAGYNGGASAELCVEPLGLGSRGSALCSAWLSPLTKVRGNPAPYLFIYWVVAAQSLAPPPFRVGVTLADVLQLSLSLQGLGSCCDPQAPALQREKQL